MPKSFNLTEISDKFQDIIAEELDTYEKELNADLDKRVEEVANEYAKDLYPEVPVSDGTGGKYGHLRDNITVSKKTKQGKKVYEVHFGKKGFLSTILEYGFTARNGKLVKTKAFVRPTFEKNKEKYYNKIKGG